MDDHDRQLLLLGREHFQHGEYDKAEYLLRQVIVKSDRYADVHHMLGVIAHTQGDFARAEAHLEKAVQLNPNYTEAQLSLMVTYNELGKYDAARRLYGQVRNRTHQEPLDPFIRGKISNMHAEVAQAYLDAGMLSHAVVELQKAIQLSPDFADLRVRLGLLYRDMGEVGLARVELEAARDQNPNYVHGRLSLGTLLLGSGQHEAARHEFEKVLELEPTHKSAPMYLRLLQSSLRTSQLPPPAPVSDPK
jgi:tetratricopeptide (TPR) repeat protein